MKMNEAMKVLMENATTFSARNKITSLMENEVKAVNNTMVSNFYKSAIEKAHVDFEGIPQSKGDLTHYSGYRSMVETLDLIEQISAKSDVKIKEVETIRTAISNIVTYRESFEKGFRLEKDFIILQYNTLVYACIESTSILISSYVDFVKRPDKNEFVIMKDSMHGRHTSISSLEKFNLAVRQGDFNKVLNAVISSGKDNLVGIDDIVIPTVIIGGVLALVPLIRELIFGFYYSRMKISDYLAQQAMLLEINKQNVQASTVPAKQKNEIIKKQSQHIDKLRRISDSIKVDSKLSDQKASIEMKKENKNWTIDEVQSQAASVDNNGFQLL